MIRPKRLQARAERRYVVMWYVQYRYHIINIFFSQENFSHPPLPVPGYLEERWICFMRDATLPHRRFLGRAGEKGGMKERGFPCICNYVHSKARSGRDVSIMLFHTVHLSWQADLGPVCLCQALCRCRSKKGLSETAF